MTESLLLVDDDVESCQSLSRALRAEGIDLRISIASSAEFALKLATKEPPSVAVIDLSLDRRRGVESGFELLRALGRVNASCRIIVLTGHGGHEHGVRALLLGAANFIEKPAHVPHLAALIRDGVSQSKLRAIAAGHVREIIEDTLIGSSPKLAEVKEAILFAASTHQSIFISGETGTGKGVCARLIHKLSNRKEEPFIRYQPSFSSADLVNSDLFGHKKGAFTGAIEDRPGILAGANKGTLFLDEVDELPVAVQVSLLGVLQERRFRVVGATQEEESQFRLISASNREIQSAIETGKIRADFFHRIAQVVIDIPPLRARVSDIPEIAVHIMTQLSEKENLGVMRIDPEVLDRLGEHSWPGNVRELQSAIESAAYRAEHRESASISLCDLHAVRGQSLASSVTTASTPFTERVELFKIGIIKDALKRNHGNQLRAAKELDLDRSTLRRVLARSGVVQKDVTSDR